MKQDPVCGMQVDEATAKDKSSFQGTEYVFCGPDCKETFEEQPERYVGEQRKEKMGTGSARSFR